MLVSRHSATNSEQSIKQSTNIPPPPSTVQCCILLRKFPLSCMVMSDFHPLLEFPTIKFMMLHNLSASSRLYTKFYLLIPVTQTTAVNNFTDIHKQTQTQTDTNRHRQTHTHTDTNRRLRSRENAGGTADNSRLIGVIAYTVIVHLAKELNSQNAVERHKEEEEDGHVVDLLT